jgi:hypothetical protein
LSTLFKAGESKVSPVPLMRGGLATKSYWIEAVTPAKRPLRPGP